MNKISFILKNPKSDKDTSIIVLYSCWDGRLKYYTGETCHPKVWPDVNKGTRAILNRIETTIQQTVTDYKIKGDPLTKQALGFQLDKVLHKKKKPVSNFFTDLTAVVDKMEDGKILTPKMTRYSAGSIKTLRFTIDFLKKFDPKMTAAGITMAMYEKFIVYCHELNLSTNYIGSQIKNWKSLGKRVSDNPIFDSDEFVKIQEDAVDIHLDEPEIAKLYNLNLSGRYALTRDWFVLDCYTGLRISDLTILKDKNHSNGLITIANKKTNEKVIIPAHPYVKAILAKHKGFPPKVNDAILNEEIKLICEKAEINDTFLHTITKGGKRQDTYLKKWQMVSAHTARRSFVTNLLKIGVPDSVIKKLTGIKSSQTLRRYDKLSVDEAARIAAGLKFFK